MTIPIRKITGPISEGGLAMIDVDANWHVVRTVAGQHEFVEEQLRVAGFEILPVRRCYEVRHARKVVEKVELGFPTYVLVQFDVKDPAWWGITRMRGVRGFIWSSSEVPSTQPGMIPTLHHGMRPTIAPATAPPAQMRALRAALGKGGFLKKEVLKVDPRLQPGTHVKISDGPFTSFDASIERLTEDQRIVVLANIFGRQTPITLDLDQVVPV